MATWKAWSAWSVTATLALLATGCGQASAVPPGSAQNQVAVGSNGAGTQAPAQPSANAAVSSNATAATQTKPANPTNSTNPANQVGQTGKSGTGTTTGTANGTTTGTSSPSVAVAQVWPTVRIQVAGHLPIGLLGNALAVSPGGAVYSVGGYTGVQSLQSIYQVTGSVQRTALLPVKTHDAAAGFLGADLYVFGGGQSASYDTIVRISGSQVSTVGHLNRPLSDAVAVPFTYHNQPGLVLVGGYDGQVFNQEVRFVTLNQGNLTWTNLFALPHGVRYPAVTSANGNLYIAGGRLASGQLSQSVYVWSSLTSTMHLVGYLGTAVEKATLFAKPGFLVVAGGSNQAQNPVTNVTAMNLETGKTQVVAHLPVPLADLGYAQTGSQGWLVGGLKSSSETDTNSDIYTLLLS